MFNLFPLFKKENKKEDYQYTCSFFSGADLKFYLELQNGQKKYIPEFREISWKEDLIENQVRGQLIFIIFDRDALVPFLQDVKNIHLKVATAVKRISELKFENVIFTERRESLSVDDLISEIHYSFTAQSCTSWKKLQ
jgi:hypothetical protein